MIKASVTKAPEAARAAVPEAKPEAHRLQGLDDGRAIVADEALRRVFGTHQAAMFEMNKLLAQCLTQDAEPGGEPGGWHDDGAAVRPRHGP